MGHQGDVGNGDDALARVATHSRETLEFLEMAVRHPGLLAQLATRTFLHGLVHAQEAARQRPHALEGRLAALDEQQAQPLAIEPEDHAIGGQRGMRILIGICCHNE